MGRKPNQLILEYYVRGAKLADASNRYAYTCKACSAHFPKGRMDSLISHLTKKCGQLSAQDKHRALLRLYQMPDQDNGESDSHEGNRGLTPAGPVAELTIGESRDLTGLEVLAEASRRMEHPTRNGQNGHEGVEEDGTIDPNLRDANPYDRVFDTASRIQHRLAISMASVAGNAATFDLPEPNYTSPYGNGNHSTGTKSPCPDLSTIAASASNLEASLLGAKQNIHAEGSDNAPRPDLHSELQGLRPPSTRSMRRPGPNAAAQEDEGSTLVRTENVPRAIAVDPTRPLRNNSGNSSSRSRAQKIRGKFSDTRRKEVQEVRKKGACIRCRMLRKTCSNGEPCDSCASIDNARLWKTPCTRTRVAAEFDLYSAGLYGALATMNAEQVNASYQLGDNAGQIMLCHHEDDNHYVICNATIGRLRSEAVDLTHLIADTDGLPSLSSIVLLGEAEAVLNEKVDVYVREMTPKIQERAASQFMQATLALATRLCIEKQDTLLGQVLELWTTTHLLVDPNFEWKILFDPNISQASMNPHREPLHRSVKSLEDGRFDSRSTKILDKHTFPATYISIDTQMRAVAEVKASTLSNRIFNDVERRLLNRSRCKGFETFLVALILLNCVESMCFMFHIFGEGEHASRWPLQLPPSHFIRQGETFSDLISFLLRLRVVTPKTVPDDDGFLIAMDTKDAAAVEWFQTVKLMQQRLQACRDAAFDASDSRSLELKYCSKLLLP